MGVIIFTTVLAVEFAVSRDTAALLTTVVFLPLGIAPLFYVSFYYAGGAVGSYLSVFVYQRFGG